MATGSLRVADYSGLYWSSTAYYSEVPLYNLDFNGSNINVSGQYGRLYGLTVQKPSKSFYISNSWRVY